MASWTEPRALTGGGAPLTADEGVSELYARHWSPMVRVAWLLVRDEQVAEEVVQDALVAVHARWDRLTDPDKAVAYLRRSVVNGARSVLRHRRVENVHLTAAAGSAHVPGRDSAPSAETGALARAAHAAMVETLAALPRRQREVLVLRYYLDLSEAQIADTLGLAPGSVKAHAHRGLAALRDRLDTTSEETR